MTSWCARCGNDLPIEPELPCELCWSARADRALVERLTAYVDWGAHRAPRLLARIGDPGAVPALREAARHVNARVRAAALASLGWSGGPAEVPLVAAALGDPDEEVREAARATLADLGGGGAADALAGNLEQLERNERLHAVEVLAWLDKRRAATVATLDAPAPIGGRRSATPASPGGPRADLPAAEPLEAQPLGERQVPRLTLAELSAEPIPDARWPPPKFGGQPDWVDEPAWPLSDDLRPLVFYGQLPLLGDPPRTGYLFFRLDPDAASWEPLGEGSALVVQPGGPCRLQTIAEATGPALFERVREPGRFRTRCRARPYERFVRLAQGADPLRWEWPQPPTEVLQRDAHGDWNKIGGTPLFLRQGAPRPGPGWEFAFQFTTAWAGRELAPGAECYGFVGDGRGILLWQAP